ncbi:hypothetical protein TNIN_374951 [Trichonephila inaurata madagascariensis]|uniref:Uncharacterized protein n=1 Tax=Trichonephila inaurata madagascariensis TaxID=2747483 RepID=A0A8X7CT05_9ARAC|nr:hypothetical protein TNIN_374951 [Trichonephila inaurata madagascariensis]
MPFTVCVPEGFEETRSKSTSCRIQHGKYNNIIGCLYWPNALAFFDTKSKVQESGPWYANVGAGQPSTSITDDNFQQAGKMAAGDWRV